MTIETARSFFLWCAILNYAFLLAWVLAAILGRGSMIRMKARFFRVSGEQMDPITYREILSYKSAISLFNIAPCIALYVIR